LKSELKWLNKYQSRTRDLDVALKRLPSSDDTRLQVQSLGRVWRKARTTSHRELSWALHSRRYRTLLRDMSVWIGSRPPDSLKHLISLTTYSDRQLNRWYKKLIKKSRVLEDMNASQRHRLRIQSKRFRYALEVLGQLLPGQSDARVRECLKSLRKIQKHLGQLNDAKQGRVIATTLAKSTRNDGPGWSSLFPTGRKARKRMVKAAALPFRQMAELKPF
jgi:CHAD domain-containing protein